MKISFENQGYFISLYMQAWTLSNLVLEDKNIMLDIYEKNGKLIMDYVGFWESEK